MYAGSFGEKQGEGGTARPMVRTRMLTTLIDGLVEQRGPRQCQLLDLERRRFSRIACLFSERLLHWNCWYCFDAASLPAVRE